MEIHEHASPDVQQPDTRSRSTETSRDELVESHYEYVLSIATSFCRKLPPGVDVDAVRGAALEALVVASRSYDPSRGWAFSTYVHTRVAGAMIDELRRLDPNSRYAHRRGTALPRPLSLEKRVEGAGDESTTLGETLRAATDVEGEFQRRLALRSLVDAIRALSDTNRAVIVRWLGGDTLQAIADDFGVDQSRISQRMTAVRRELAAALAY